MRFSFLQIVFLIFGFNDADKTSFSCGFSSLSPWCSWHLSTHDNCLWILKRSAFKDQKGFLYLSGNHNCSSSIQYVYEHWREPADYYMTIEYYVIGTGPFSLIIHHSIDQEAWFCQIQPGRQKRTAHIALRKSMIFISITGIAAKDSTIILTQIWKRPPGLKTESVCPSSTPTPKQPLRKPYIVKSTILKSITPKSPNVTSSTTKPLSQKAITFDPNTTSVMPPSARTTTSRTITTTSPMETATILSSSYNMTKKTLKSLTIKVYSKNMESLNTQNSSGPRSRAWYRNELPNSSTEDDYLNSAPLFDSLPVSKTESQNKSNGIAPTKQNIEVKSILAKKDGSSTKIILGCLLASLLFILLIIILIFIYRKLKNTSNHPYRVLSFRNSYFQND